MHALHGFTKPVNHARIVVQSNLSKQLCHARTKSNWVLFQKLLLQVDQAFEQCASLSRIGMDVNLMNKVRKHVVEWDTILVDYKDNMLFFMNKLQHIDWNEVMRAASHHNLLSVLKMSIQHGANDWNGANLIAAKSNHFDIVRYIIDHYDQHKGFGHLFYWFGYYGNLEMLQYFSPKSESEWLSSFCSACRFNRVRMVQWIIKQHPTFDYQKAVYHVRLSENRQIIRMFVQSSGLTCWSAYQEHFSCTVDLSVFLSKCGVTDIKMNMKYLPELLSRRISIHKLSKTMHHETRLLIKKRKRDQQTFLNVITKCKCNIDPSFAKSHVLPYISFIPSSVWCGMICNQK